MFFFNTSIFSIRRVLVVAVPVVSGMLKIQTVTEEQWDRCYAVNVKAPLFLSQVRVPAFVLGVLMQQRATLVGANDDMEARFYGAPKFCMNSGEIFYSYSSLKRPGVERSKYCILGALLC